MSKAAKSVPLEKATAAELVAAIKAEYAIGDVRRRLEHAIYWQRVHALMAKAERVQAEMNEFRQPPGGKFCPVRAAKYMEKLDKLGLINSRLDRMMDIATVNRP